MFEDYEKKHDEDNEKYREKGYIYYEEHWEDPLNHAIKTDDLESFEHLIKEEKNLDIFNELGQSALHTATLRKKIKEIRLLGKAMVNMDIHETNRDRTSLHLAVIYLDDPRIINELIKAGANPDSRNSYRGTPLDDAAFYNNLKSARALIKNGADVDAIDWSEKTPLYKAVHKGNVAMVGLLMRKDADPHIPDNKGMTPFKLAKWRRNKRIFKTICKYEELREEEKQKAAFGRVGRPCDGGNKGPSR